MSESIIETAEQPRDRSRFDLFTVLRPGQEQRYPNKKPEWTYRGDKYTNEPAKMLQSLLRMANNHGGKWKLFELYDNTRPRNDADRIILRVKDGVIEKNLLRCYSAMLKDFAMPVAFQ